MRLFIFLASLCFAPSLSAATIFSSVSVGSGSCGSSSFSDGLGGADDYGTFADDCGATAYFGHVENLGAANGGASARASFGSVGVFVQSVVLTPQNVAGSIHWESIATANFSDGISASIDSGTIAMRLDLSGTLAGMTGFPSQYQSVAEFSAYVVSAGSIYSYGQFAGYEGFVVTGEAGVVDFFMPIVNGHSAIYASLVAKASCGSAVLGDGYTLCRSTVDFYSSLRFIGASVFDIQGELVRDATLVSESGFDYISGVEPHIAPVPLPSTGWLILLSLGCLMAFRRSGSRNANDLRPLLL